MKKYLVLFIVLMLACALTACNLSPAAQGNNAGKTDAPAVGTDSGSTSTDADTPADGDAPSVMDGGARPESEMGYGGKTLPIYGRKDGMVLDATGVAEGYMPLPSGSDESENSAPRAGLLTACAYDDHEFVAYWQGLVGSTQDGKGKFAQYFDEFAFKAYYQVQVTVEGVPGAKVKLIEGDDTLSSAVTDNAGVAFVYAPARPDGAKVVVEVPLAEGGYLTLEKAAEGHLVSFGAAEVEGALLAKHKRIAVMFVIDTTGSMGDEIRYLQKEIEDVIGNIRQLTTAEVSLAVMVYRDDPEEDDYTTRYSGFTTDLTEQKAFLAQQDAAGGGDFEEAVDVALTEATNAQWPADATKILIHVADAPAHDKDVDDWNEAVQKAAAEGIRIVSVASSGIDEKTEYFFRSQSLLTGGVYVYLTNDSGIGNDHLEATVETRPQVEPLNDCLVRVIGALYEGNHTITRLPEPAPEQDAPAEGDAE